MLILTRRVGETIVIGDDVVVTVLGIKGNQVRVGINAPKDVSVHREEIYQRIQQERNTPDTKDTTESKASGSTAKDEKTDVPSDNSTTASPAVSTNANGTTTTIKKKRSSKLDSSKIESDSDVNGNKS